MQTPCDVIDAALRGGTPERIGLSDGPWNDTLRDWVAEGYPTDEEGEPRPPVDVFKYDMVNVGGWFDLMPLRGQSEVLEETDEWHVVRNGAGAVHKWWKNKSGTPEHVDFDMTSREVWERKYRPHLLEPDRERLDVEGTRRELERRRREGLFTLYGHLFVWENARQSMGDLTLYESMLLDPEWMHDYNRVYTDFFKAHFRVLFEEAGLPDGVRICEDLGYHNGLFCSPKALQEITFPYYAELVEFFHSYDLPVMLHSCGLVREALPLIVGAGFDCLDPMERKAGNEPLEYARDWGERIAFMGGLDVRVLESGDRERIRREVIRLIEGMKSAGARYIFHSDHSLSTNIDLDDYRFALDVYREHMRY